MKLQSVRNSNSNFKNQTFQHNTTQRHYLFDTHWGMTIRKYEKALISIIKSLWFFKSRKLCSTKSLKFTADGGLILKCFRQHHLACMAWGMLIPECSRCVFRTKATEKSHDATRASVGTNTSGSWHIHYLYVLGFVHSQHIACILSSETFNFLTDSVTSTFSYTTYS